jgi:hypothetical protein
VHQARAFEAVDHAGHSAGGEADLLGQRAGGQGAAAQQGERPLIACADPQSLADGLVEHDHRRAQLTSCCRAPVHGGYFTQLDILV